MKNETKIQGENPFLLSYSDLMAALLLVFILLLTSTLLKIQQEINERKNDIDRITVIKDEIVAELRNAFEEEGIDIEIDPNTGAITFKEEDIHFDTGSATLKPEGMARLDQVMPVYLNVLLGPRFATDVTQIIVEGHTDPQAFNTRRSNRFETAYLDNLDLSLQRASAVVYYVLRSDYTPYIQSEGFVNLNGYSDKIKRLLSANGASFSEPLDINGNVVPNVPYREISDGTFDPATSPIDYSNSRRVEIQFRLNDEEYLRQIRDILNNMNIENTND